jgi:hypothetical protein
MKREIIIHYGICWIWMKNSPSGSSRVTPNMKKPKALFYLIYPELIINRH